MTSDPDVARDWWLGAALATHDGATSDSELRKVLTSDLDIGPEPLDLPVAIGEFGPKSSVE